ncbi:MAG: tetratricopeptide repeat protein [Acidobacteriota bacterium]
MGENRTSGLNAKLQTFAYMAVIVVCAVILGEKLAVYVMGPPRPIEKGDQFDTLQALVPADAKHALVLALSPTCRKQVFQALCERWVNNFEHLRFASRTGCFPTVCMARQFPRPASARGHLSIYRFEPGHPSIAVRQSNLAMVLQDLGELEEARDLLRAAHKSLLEGYGPDFPLTKTASGNLAVVEKAMEG